MLVSLFSWSAIAAWLAGQRRRCSYSITLFEGIPGVAKLKRNLYASVSATRKED